MNKRSNLVSVLGTIIMCVFGGVVFFNLKNMDSAASFYSKIDSIDVVLTKINEDQISISSEVNYQKYCITNKDKSK